MNTVAWGGTPGDVEEVHRVEGGERHLRVAVDAMVGVIQLRVAVILVEGVELLLGLLLINRERGT